MNQPFLFEQTPRLTVTELTRYIRKILDEDHQLQDIWIRGEISNASRPSSGHLYFTLKDAGASLRCVMWRSDAARLQLRPQDGIAVEAHGYVSVYEPGGQYQLYVDLLQPAGEGALFQEFLRLKAMLEAEGLFEVARKRAIPSWPARIGIVTSPTGAAIRDILNTLRRRFPLAEVVLSPSPVQGAEAPESLVAAINRLNIDFGPDVILMARGGGSIEDLWAFNDERVVRAVVNSTAPVISGIGHETDFTLVDFAADLRAATPTAAAELATPITINDLQLSLAAFTAQLEKSVRQSIRSSKENLRASRENLEYNSPARRIQSLQQRVDEIARRSELAIQHALGLERERLNGVKNRLVALNPSAVLARGFAIVSRQQDGRIVKSVHQASAGDGILIRVSDGTIVADVKEN